LLPGADQVAYVGIDATIRRTYGYAKQGAGYGSSKVKGLNAPAGIVSTPLAAPVIAATRLRTGPSNSAREAAAFAAESIRTARACGADGLLAVRADSAFYGAGVVNVCRSLNARFSITVRVNASVEAAIAGIDESGWKAGRYPKRSGTRRDSAGSRTPRQPRPPTPPSPRNRGSSRAPPD
jgi:hypothetical protein